MENNIIDNQLIFVEPTWVTGETCLFKISNKFEYLRAQSKLTKMRKDFLTKLENEGFRITYDKKEIDEDTICFIMNDESVCDVNVDISDYKKQFDKKIFCSGGEKLNYPYSVTMEEYFFNPFFPAVLKNELMNAGIDKFFIENENQLEIIKKFYQDFSNDKELAEAFRCSIFQQFIETPTKNKTYIRVLMSASGDVLGASLKYSKPSFEKRDLKGMFEPYFSDPSSSYFLNSSNLFNYYSEGGNISFSQPRYSDEKKFIIKAHNIDPDHPEIPSDVLEVSSLIARNCNQELGIMCGLDFIFNVIDQKWYYLESQAFPAIDEWANARDIRLPKVKSLDDSIKYFAIDLEARYEALMMCMKKKYEEKHQDNVPVLKLKA